jgi:hypothetical protein
MSTNLHLKAVREVFTKSGKSSTQFQTINLWQTPKAITNEILEFKTFDEQLEAYCKWADTRQLSYDDDCYWSEIFDTQIKHKEEYFFLSPEELEEFGNDFWEDCWVKDVVLVNEPRFDEVADNFDLVVDEELVGFRLVCTKLHSEIIRNTIKQLKEEEYEFEFYPL